MILKLILVLRSTEEWHIFCSKHMYLTAIRHIKSNAACSRCMCSRFQTDKSLRKSLQYQQTCHHFGSIRYQINNSPDISAFLMTAFLLLTIPQVSDVIFVRTLRNLSPVLAFLGWAGVKSIPQPNPRSPHPIHIMIYCTHPSC